MQKEVSQTYNEVYLQTSILACDPPRRTRSIEMRGPKNLSFIVFVQIVIIFIINIIIFLFFIFGDDIKD